MLLMQLFNIDDVGFELWSQICGIFCIFLAYRKILKSIIHVRLDKLKKNKHLMKWSKKIL